MRFDFFSRTQLRALSWWSDSSPYRDLDALICDGAVRSGKTLCMGISFVCWAMRRFDNERFGICGKAKDQYPPQSVRAAAAGAAGHRL